MAHAYGFWPAPRPMTYDDFVGLHLNLPRARHRGVWDARQAARYDRTTEPLPPEFYDAQALTEAEAVALETHETNQRVEADAYARLAALGWRG